MSNKDLQEYIQQKKEFYDILIDFLQNEDEDNINNADELYDLLQNTILKEDIEDTKTVLRVILKISNNHRRNPNFDKKIEQILSLFIDQLKQNFSNSEIFELFKSNKRILLFLIKKEIIKVDKPIVNHMLSKVTYCEFFYPEIKNFLNENDRKRIEEKLMKIDSNILTYFDEYCKTGDNNSYISSLIRQDLIDDFVAYFNQANISLSTTKIERSVFETNSFLLKQKEVSLIQYASFFGSVQIFKFLQFNGVELNPSLWFYAIHGQNPEIIHILEDNHIEPSDKTYEECLIESIKCHHNAIANYIENNLSPKKIFKKRRSKFRVISNFSEKKKFSGIRYYNYSFFPEYLDKIFPFFYFNKYNHVNIVKFYFETKKDLIEKIIHLMI